MDSKRIQIRIPGHLLDQIDRIAEESQINRSQFIQNCVQVYIMEKEPHGLRERLQVGYQIMAELNLKLAEEGNDDELLEAYERQLAEAE